MTAPGYAPGYYGKAEELAAEARRYLGQEDGKDTTAILAAVARCTLHSRSPRQSKRPLPAGESPRSPRLGSFRP